jgi:methionine sulfoxide reductase heme-binding subunit
MSFSLHGPGLWYLARAAGLVTLVLLTASVVMGILVTANFSGTRWPRFLTVGLHRNLGLLVLIFLALHVGTTVADTYTSISLRDALVPFTGSYKQPWLGLGAVALDLVIALTVTSLLRQRLGYRIWRAVHWCGYLCWPVALAHGAGIGTDRTTPWVFYLTCGCLAAVFGAAAIRIIMLWPERKLLRIGVVVAAAASVLSIWTVAGGAGL